MLASLFCKVVFHDQSGLAAQRYTIVLLKNTEESSGNENSALASSQLQIYLD